MAAKPLVSHRRHAEVIVAAPLCRRVLGTATQRRGYNYRPTSNLRNCASENFRPEPFLTTTRLIDGIT